MVEYESWAITFYWAITQKQHNESTYYSSLLLRCYSWMYISSEIKNYSSSTLILSYSLQFVKVILKLDTEFNNSWN